MMQQEQSLRCVRQVVGFVVVDRYSATVEIGVQRQPCYSSREIKTGIGRVVSASGHAIDGAAKAATGSRDAISELGICRVQTDSRSVYRNDHHVGVVRYAVKRTRCDVIDEAVGG